MTSPALAVTQWTATAVPASSSDSKSNFPNEVYSQWAILQTLLQNYRQGYYLTYDNSSTLSIGPGEVSAWSGTASLFLQNTSPQTATTANLDTGATFSASTTYYVYATSSSTTQATATIVISLNNTAPSVGTYIKKLGNFTTDSGGNIAQIVDNAVVAVYGPYVSQSVNTIYQATTDGTLMSTITCGGGIGSGFIITDTSPSPTTILIDGSCAVGANAAMTATIRKGDYYKTTVDGGATQTFLYFRPSGQ
jgi:hypothetical protein